MTVEDRAWAIKLAARFALIGEDAIASVARVEFFMTSGRRALPATHSKSLARSQQLTEGPEASAFPEGL